jgi:hypothetical protein
VRFFVLTYRILGGLVVAAFCLCHLGSLLEWNLRYPLGDNRFEDVLGAETSRKLHELTGKWCRTFACEQRWNMFSNVGASSDVPLIVLVRKNGTRVLLHSDLEPELVSPPPGGDYLSGSLSEEQREVNWRFNFGNGRIRKMEDNVLSGPQGYSSARFSYIRYRLREYLAASGESADNIVHIDLQRLRVIHPDDEGPARIGGALWVMQYDMRMDSYWRKP